MILGAPVERMLTRAPAAASGGGRGESFMQSLEAGMEVREPLPKEIGIDGSGRDLSLQSTAECGEREPNLADLGRRLAHRRLRRKNLELLLHAVDGRRDLAQQAGSLDLWCQWKDGGLVVQRHPVRVCLERATMRLLGR